MNRCRGIFFALASVLLVSGAQLSMRWSMTRLPRPDQWLALPGVDSVALVVVLAAIFAYALSMLCWLAALRDLPLGRAYSLLSISYALVYLLAASCRCSTNPSVSPNHWVWRWSCSGSSPSTLVRPVRPN